MRGYLLQIKHIIKSYQDGTGKNVVLNDISLNDFSEAPIATIFESKGTAHSVSDEG